jgi:hypothetical protein
VGFLEGDFVIFKPKFGDISNFESFLSKKLFSIFKYFYHNWALGFIIRVMFTFQAIT